MKKSKQLLFMLFLVSIVILSACSQNTEPELETYEETPLKTVQETLPEFETYEGPRLNIAVIGDSPEIRENQVTFKQIAFNELDNDEVGSFDAVFVMEDKLAEASKDQYADLYLSSSIPIFFVSAKNYIPFTETVAYDDESWAWEEGNSYVSGILQSQTDETLSSWGFGLYNDEKTPETIQATYSIIFEKIEEITS